MASNCQANIWTNAVPLANLYIFIQETAWENVVLKMAAILSQPQRVEFIPMKDKGLCFLHSQSHGCWWPDDVKRQGLNYHSIDVAKVIEVGDTYMHVYNRPPSLQIIAWCLFGTKPLSEPMAIIWTNEEI